MPLGGAEIALLGAAGIGAGGSLAGGKKAGGAQKAQGRLMQEGLELSRGLVERFEGPFGQAVGFYESLLKGGQTARLAVEPALQGVDLAAEAQRREIEMTQPRGGERNLALAKSRIGQAGTRGQAYVGAQREAAGALGALSQIPLGAAPSFFGTAAQTGQGLLSFQALRERLATEGATGVGRGIFGMQQKKQRKEVGGAAAPTATGTAPTTATSPRSTGPPA